MRSALFSLALVGAVAGVVGVGAAGCRPVRATVPLKRCEDHCRRDLPACDDEACARGCRVASDREVEGIARAVFACVARESTCAEATFARCAVTQGVHADGGPPTPASYPDDD